MRKVGAYAFSHDVDGGDRGQPDDIFSNIGSLAIDWLRSKGVALDDLTATELEFQMVDGRKASLRTELVESSSGKLFELRFSESIDDGQFLTTIAFGYDGNQIACDCVLETGRTTTRIAPIRVNARCPGLVRHILNLETPWFVESTPLSRESAESRGNAAGRELSTQIRDPARELPLVVISGEEGLTLHRGVEQDMAHATLGHATVVLVNTEASWALTNCLGKEWSCFNGAIRLYWPGATETSDPFSHSLWTTTRLMDRVDSTEEAGRRICDQIRRKLMGVSAFTVRRPAVLDQIARQSRQEEFEADRTEARDNDTLYELLDEQQEQIVRLQKDIVRKDAEHAAAFEWQGWQQPSRDEEDTSPEEAEPVRGAPPETVVEAVEAARVQFGNRIVFGDDVPEGVDGLNKTAGPPDKVFYYLQCLHEAAGIRIAGQEWGNSLIEWLKAKGIKASIESEAIRNNRGDMRKRTWRINGESRQFEKHMKPTNATAPDKCVRIYFDWCNERNRMLVGWIGRHPD